VGFELFHRRERPFLACAEAAEILGPGFDPEIVEMHHHLKKDAPSGPLRRWLKF